MSGIEIGEGEAHELESIKFQVNWSRKPEKHDITASPVAAVTASGTGSETSGRAASPGASRSSETESTVTAG